MLLMGISVDWTKPRKASMNLKIDHYKFPKLKCKERKTKIKKKKNIQ